MKKIILLLAILSVSLISSCSNDDDSNTTPTPADVFSAKINGTQKNFTVTNVDVIENPDYTDLEITALLNNDPTNAFELNLTRDNGEIYFVQYSELGNYYQPSENFTVTISENSTNKLKGTFSGVMQETSDPLNTITITDGSFDIYY